MFKLNFQVSPDEVLPKSVCLDCADRVITYHDFKIKCIENQKRLKSMLLLPSIPCDELKEEEFLDEPDFYFPSIDEPGQVKNSLEINFVSCNLKIEPVDIQDVKLEEDEYFVETLDDIDAETDTKTNNDCMKTPCHLCSKKVVTQRLKFHLKNKHDILPYHCKAPKCDKSFFKLLSYHTHMLVEHGGKIEAEEGDDNHTRDDKDQKTKKALYNRKSQKCHICEVVTRRSYMNVHLAKVHGKFLYCLFSYLNYYFFVLIFGRETFIPL